MCIREYGGCNATGTWCYVRFQWHCIHTSSLVLWVRSSFFWDLHQRTLVPLLSSSLSIFCFLCHLSCALLLMDLRYHCKNSSSLKSSCAWIPINLLRTTVGLLHLFCLTRLRNLFIKKKHEGKASNRREENNLNILSAIRELSAKHDMTFQKQLISPNKSFIPFLIRNKLWPLIKKAREKGRFSWLYLSQHIYIGVGRPGP